MSRPAFPRPAPGACGLRLQLPDGLVLNISVTTQRDTCVSATRDIALNPPPARKSWVKSSARRTAAIKSLHKTHSVTRYGPTAPLPGFYIPTLRRLLCRSAGPCSSRLRPFVPRLFLLRYRCLRCSLWSQGRSPERINLDSCSRTCLKLSGSSATGVLLDKPRVHGFMV